MRDWTSRCIDTERDSVARDVDGAVQSAGPNRTVCQIDPLVGSAHRQTDQSCSRQVARHGLMAGLDESHEQYDGLDCYKIVRADL